MDDRIEIEGIEFSIADSFKELTECFYCGKIYNAMTDDYVKQENIIDERKVKKNGLCKACFMDIEEAQNYTTKTKIL